MMNDQASNLRRKIQRQKHDCPHKTISIVSGKGGVGKSNIAVNFTLELLRHQKRVLLFDLDIGMGNVDILLGLQAKYTVIDMLQQRLSIEEIIECGPRNLSYISGGNGINQLFSMTDDDASYFLDEYEKLQHMYDYIIFDLGAGATQDSMFFILASDECIVVTTPEPTSITDAYGMVKHIVNNDQNMPIYIVMNRSTHHASGKKALARFQDVVLQFLNKHVKAMGVLPDDKLVLKAVMRQTPIMILNKRSPMSQAMQHMTAKYLDFPEKSMIKGPLSFVQKLRKLLKER